MILAHVNCGRAKNAKTKKGPFYSSVLKQLWNSFGWQGSVTILTLQPWQFLAASELQHHVGAKIARSKPLWDIQVFPLQMEKNNWIIDQGCWVKLLAVKLFREAFPTQLGLSHIISELYRFPLFLSVWGTLWITGCVIIFCDLVVVNFWLPPGCYGVSRSRTHQSKEMAAVETVAAYQSSYKKALQPRALDTPDPLSHVCPRPLAAK